MALDYFKTQPNIVYIDPHNIPNTIASSILIRQTAAGGLNAYLHNQAFQLHNNIKIFLELQ